MQTISKQIKELEDNEELDDIEKALLLLALTNLLQNKDKIRKIRLLHIDRLEMIRREVAYTKLYNRDLKGLKGLLQKIGKELTDEEVALISSSLSESYKDSYSKVLELLNQEGIELNEDDVEREVYKRFYNDTFDNRIEINNNLFLSDMLDIAEGLESGDIGKIDREIEGSITNKIERSEVLFENELMRVFNQAVVGAYVVSKVVNLRYSAVLDERTCSECGDYDGTIYNIDDHDIPDLPLHPGCRCILTLE